MMMNCTMQRENLTVKIISIDRLRWINHIEEWHKPKQAFKKIYFDKQKAVERMAALDWYLEQTKNVVKNAISTGKQTQEEKTLLEYDNRV